MTQKREFTGTQIGTWEGHTNSRDTDTHMCTTSERAWRRSGDGHGKVHSEFSWKTKPLFVTSQKTKQIYRKEPNHAVGTGLITGKNKRPKSSINTLAHSTKH